MNLYNQFDISRQILTDENEYIAHYNNFTLHSVFQPIWSKWPIQLYGYEAQVRVLQDHDIKISPLDFLGQLTDDTEITNIVGLIGSLHIRNFARAQLKGKLFINVPPAAFIRISDEQSSFFRILKRIMDEGLTTENIVLEITESKSKDTHLLMTSINKFKGSGIHIAIDNFGTEESNYLRVELFNPEYVKIDRSLVQAYCNAPDKHGLGDMINTFNRQGIRVILEGIETIREHQIIQSLSYDYAQGYYYV